MVSFRKPEEQARHIQGLRKPHFTNLCLDHNSYLIVCAPALFAGASAGVVLAGRWLS